MYISRGTPVEVIVQELESCSTDTITCDSTAVYRTADGSCNNLDNPTWGQAGIIQERLVPAAYGKTSCLITYSHGFYKKGLNN